MTEGAQILLRCAWGLSLFQVEKLTALIPWQQFARPEILLHMHQPIAPTYSITYAPTYSMRSLDWTVFTALPEDSFHWGQFSLRTVFTEDRFHWGQFSLRTVSTEDSFHWGRFSLRTVFTAQPEEPKLEVFTALCVQTKLFMLVFMSYFGSHLASNLSPFPPDFPLLIPSLPFVSFRQFLFSLARYGYRLFQASAQMPPEAYLAM